MYTRREQDIARAILQFAPVAERMLALEEMADKFWRKPEFVHPQLPDLLQGTPLTIKKEPEGRWGYDLTLRHVTTGGSGFKTYEDAFRNAIKRYSEMDFATGDDDDGEEWD